MVLDSLRNEVVLFGGLHTNESGNDAIIGDTWKLQGGRWSRVVVPGPSARFGHAMAFDDVRGRVVLFGGQTNDGRSDETWEWDGTRWERRTPQNRPARRRDHSMAFDPLSGRVILYGGRDFDGVLRTDTWMWDGSNWSLAAQGYPPEREWPAMVTQSEDGSVLLWGGDGSGRTTDGSNYKYLHGTGWTAYASYASCPSGLRYGHSMTWDLSSGDWIAYGGAWFAFFHDTVRQCQVVPSQANPGTRMWSAMAFDSVLGHCVLFGGLDPQSPVALDDAWAWVAAGPIGDTNSDRRVDASDLSVVLAQFGQDVSVVGKDGDVNFDGMVDAADLNVLLSRFGTYCS